MDQAKRLAGPQAERQVCWARVHMKKVDRVHNAMAAYLMLQSWMPQSKRDARFHTKLYFVMKLI